MTFHSLCSSCNAHHSSRLEVVIQARNWIVVDLVDYWFVLLGWLYRATRRIYGILTDLGVEILKMMRALVVVEGLDIGKDLRWKGNVV